MTRLKKSVVGLLAVGVLFSGVAVMESPASATGAVSFYDVTSVTSVSGGGVGTAYAYCNSGDDVTGGGFVFNNGVDVTVRESAPVYPAGTPGWYVEGINNDSVSRNLIVHAVCAHQ